MVFELDFRTPAIPIIANTTAQPKSTAAEMRQEILQQICGCVRWQSSIEYMIDAGVDTFIEIGPGQVLAGLIKRINNEVRVININNADSVAAMNFEN